MPSVAIDQHDRILLELNEAFGEHAAVSVMSRDLLACREARFVVVTDEAAVLELEVHETDPAFLAPAFCVVSFVSNGRSFMFTTHVKQNVSRTGFPTRLAIEIPRLMRRSDQRLAVRAAVARGVEIRADLDLGDVGPKLAAAVIDLSLCGALIELDQPAAILRLDQRAFVELTHAELRVRLRVLVRRVSAPRYGIYFPDAVVSSRLEPPPVLKELVTRLLRASHGA